MYPCLPINGKLQHCEINYHALIMNVHAIGSTNRGFDFTVGYQISHLTNNGNYKQFYLFEKVKWVEDAVNFFRNYVKFGTEFTI